MSDFTTSRTMMVDTQVRPSDVTKFPIIDAMLTIRRECFVPEALQPVAYAGEIMEMEGGRFILDPRSFAKLLDAMAFDGSELVLDLGCALGYSAAVIAQMTDAVVAVEDSASMVADAEAALRDEGIDNVVVVEAPLSEGAPQHGPYDAILIQGGVEQIPQPLIEQLKDGGHIGAIFMDGVLGTAKIGYKSEGRISWRMSFNATAPILDGFAKTSVFTL